MNLISGAPKIEVLLHKHDVLSVETAQPRMAIKCNHGILWVTYSGDYEDHFLVAGNRVVPPKKGKVVIEAIKDSSLNVEEKVSSLLGP